MLHHAYLIKGWLLDKDPPKEVIEALEALIAGCNEREPVVIHGNPFDVTVVPLSHREVPESAAPARTEPSTFEPEPPTVDQSKPRRKHNMSPEAREAARQRMIDMQARKRAERETGSTEPEPTPTFTEAELRITVPKPRRKSQLTDADWPEIKEMLSAGRSRTTIASDYDEEPENLDFFIASCERREAKTPGEAHAPLSGQTAGARQTW